MAYLSGWAEDKRIELTIDSSKVSTGLTDFPVMVKLSASAGIGGEDLTAVFDELGSESKKIAITTSGGTTQCYAEVVYWDETGEDAILWTKVPAVLAATDTSLYLYYDSTQDDNTDYVGDPGSAAAQNVWDSDYVQVFHMNDSTFLMNCATGVTVTTQGTLTEVDSPKGKALQANGVGDYIDISSALNLGNNFSFELQTYIVSGGPNPGYDQAFGKEKTIGLMLDHTAGTLNWGVFLGNGSSWDGSQLSDTRLSEDTWYNLGLTKDGTSLNYYNNGSADGGGSITDRSVNSTFYIFRREDQADTFTLYGNIGEFRLSTTARSASWQHATNYALLDTLVSYSLEVEAEWLDGFSNRIKATIGASLIDSELTDFPVMIHLSDSCGIGGTDLSEIFDDLGTNSKKIAITTSGGTTQCPVEIENWDNVGEKAVLHTKVPVIGATDDTVLYLYFNSAANDNTTYVGTTGATIAQTVWNDDFVSVHHMMQDPSGGANCILDSTDSELNGTPENMDVGNWEDMTFGKGLRYNGQNEGINFGDTPLVDFADGDFSFMAKISVEDFVNMGVIWGKDGPGQRQFEFAYMGNWEKELIIDYFAAAANYQLKTDANTITAPGEHVIYAVRESDYLRIYMDGVEIKSESLVGSTSMDAKADELYLGKRGYGNYFEGVIGEAQIMSVAPPAPWVKATYNTLYDTLITYSAVKTNTWIGSFAERRPFAISASSAALTDFPVTLYLDSSCGIGSDDLTSIFDILAFSANDDFTGDDGDPLNTDRWAANTGITIQSNAAYATVDGEVKYVRSAFVLPGDFDIQVDYNVLAGPGSDYWYLHLIAAAAGGDDPNDDLHFQVRRKYNSGHYYAKVSKDVGGWNSETNEATADTSGTLRITRVGNEFTAFAWTGGTWDPIGSPETVIDLDAKKMEPAFRWFSGSGNPTMTATFDNFVVNSGSIEWPSGHPNNKKIAIGDANGGQCYVEIDTWDSLTEKAILHTKVRSVPATGATIYLYYDPDQDDNTDYVGDVTDAPAQSVWDSGFEGVYHLNEDPGPAGAGDIKDSTSNEKNMIAEASMTPDDLVDAQPGKGIEFDGSNDYLVINSSVLSNYPCTIEAAGPAKVVGTTNTSPSAAVADASSISQMITLNIWDGFVRSVTTNTKSVTGTTALTDGDFCHIASALSSSTSRSVFTNGKNKTTDTASQSFPTGLDRTSIGAVRDNSPGYRVGITSEVRFSSVLRSQGWLESTFYTLKDKFGTWGATEPYGGSDGGTTPATGSTEEPSEGAFGSIVISGSLKTVTACSVIISGIWKDISEVNIVVSNEFKTVV
jgi:hypothetical protein